MFFPIPIFGDSSNNAKRIARIETKIDLLLAHAGLTYEPFKGLPGPVVEALKDGRKILAIKRYREATGTGLKEAKDFIDSLECEAV